MRVLFGAGVSCAVATETKVLRHPSKALQCGKGGFTLLGLTPRPSPPVLLVRKAGQGRSCSRCKAGADIEQPRLLFRRLPLGFPSRGRATISCSRRPRKAKRGCACSTRAHR